MKNTIKVLFVSYLLLLWICQLSGGRVDGYSSVRSQSIGSSLVTNTTFREWLENPKPIVSAHRGGPYPGFPENAIETFQYMANQIPGVVIECDVSMTKDSVLVLMHDKTLDRTSTGSGDVNDISYDKIKDLWLIDNDGDTSSFQIPTLENALQWGRGKVLFTLDVKRGVPFDKVIKTVEKYNAAPYAAIITYRIKDAELVHSLNPDVIISVSAGDDGAIQQITASKIPASNLLGFVGTREPDPAHYKKLQYLGIKSILGTLGNLDKSAMAKGDDSVYLTYIENGANIIATDRPLEVAKVIKKLTNLKD